MGGAPPPNVLQQAQGSIVQRASNILLQQSARPQSFGGGSASPFRAVPTDFGKRAEQLRDQAQDLLDTVVRLLEGAPLGPTFPPTETAPATVRVKPAELPQLRRAQASLGQLAATALAVINESGAPASVVLRASSLVNEQGDELPASLVQFTPNLLDLAPDSELPVQVTMRIPEDAPLGSYSGLIVAVGLEAVRALMFVDVIAVDT